MGSQLQLWPQRPFPSRFPAFPIRSLLQTVIMTSTVIVLNMRPTQTSLCHPARSGGSAVQNLQLGGHESLLSFYHGMLYLELGSDRQTDKQAN